MGHPDVMRRSDSRSLSPISLFVLLSISACAPRESEPQPTVDQGMAHILNSFDQVGAVRFPMVRAGSVLPAEMNRPMSWHWSGPVDRAVLLIANRLGYQAEIPAASAVPTVRIDREDTTIGGLLDEIAAASAGRAVIEVDVPNHTLRVIWHA